MIKDFIETNDNGEVSDSTLWETLKVVICGDIMSYTYAAKKEKKQLSEINNTLQAVDRA